MKQMSYSVVIYRDHEGDWCAHLVGTDKVLYGAKPESMCRRLAAHIDATHGRKR